MFASRLAPSLRALPRQASAVRMARRGYAEAADGKLQLSLVLPHQSLYSSAGVIQVNLPAATGDMGILANHVPSVEALRAGVVEVIEENGQAGKKWFVSSGFATVHGNNTLTINAVEAYQLDKFSPENIRSALADANRVLSSSAPESEKAEARIEVEVFEGLQAALNK
ncbi:ATP synthase F1, epsilon subunit [Kwoniella shivajii]|uniref:ATP synthase subunit delta, mitochondrial n=1 Tax=Kwoniella shivajii TaxID=564305 RepID=A0ABZ1D0C3_9TREE|nr:ATP synthase F1, epsilon subunit [Kwoniella shivajii]